MTKERYIVHVDMDAFFAAIEQRDNAQFRGKPVIIGADPKAGRGRGVVSACSYEARKYGIHSAMPISAAYNICPHAIFLPVNMKKYSEVSSQIYNILYDFTPQIELISIDEAFLDISGTYHLFGTPYTTCLLIKSRIREKTHLTASVGLAPTKMAAKIASDLKKPDGMVEVTQQGLLDFLRPLDISKIWGLGKKTRAILNNMGINIIGDLAKRDVKDITAVLGKNGTRLWQLANGIDDSKVEAESEAKSISNEVTFDRDTSYRGKIEGALMSLCERVSRRLRQEDFKCRTITLKIRLKDFHTCTRSITISTPTNFVDIIYKEVKQLYDDFDTEGKKVRLIGVKLSNLLPLNFQHSLFKESADAKKEKIHEAVDKIKERFGDSSIHRASTDRDSDKD